jgi:hypothetical protein
MNDKKKVDEQHMKKNYPMQLAHFPKEEDR